MRSVADKKLSAVTCSREIPVSGELSRFRIGIGAIHFRRHDNVIAHSEMFITEHFRLLSDSL